MDEKRCAACGIVKPYTDFSPAKRMASGRASYCRPCSSAKNRSYYFKDPEKARANNRRRAQAYRDKRLPPRESERRGRLKKYGITPQEWDEMFLLQHGVCAICETEEPSGQGKTLHVDHDHTTGEVRGLLCHSCNVGIGHFDHKVGTLQAAIEYLQRG